MQEIVIGVGGMSCQGCVKNVTGVLQALPGVERVAVSLEEAQATIAFDPAKVSDAFRDFAEKGASQSKEAYAKMKQGNAKPKAKQPETNNIPNLFNF